MRATQAGFLVEVEDYSWLEIRHWPNSSLVQSGVRTQNGSHRCKSFLPHSGGLTRGMGKGKEPWVKPERGCPQEKS